MMIVYIYARITRRDFRKRRSIVLMKEMEADYSKAIEAVFKHDVQIQPYEDDFAYIFDTFPRRELNW